MMIIKSTSRETFEVHDKYINPTFKAPLNRKTETNAS